MLVWLLVPSVASALAPPRLLLSQPQPQPTLTIAEIPGSAEGVLARGLGYVVGAGSLLLYTPIAIRVCRQRNADGLTLSTWWLKLFSYTCSDVYSFSNHYPVSTYLETLIITLEAAAVLTIVAYFQRRLDLGFAAVALGYAAACVWALTAAPAEAIALGQAAATLLNTAAVLPQLLQNLQRRSPGDYSPLTAGLACAGCTIRLFTTVQLAGSDPLLLAGFGSGLAINGLLLAQIGWYGVVVEGRPLVDVLTADFVSGSKVHAASKETDDESEETEPMRGARKNSEDA